MKTIATLANTNADVWHVSAADGQHIATFRGSEELVLGSASAYLIANVGCPQGEWVRRGPGRYSFRVAI